MTFNQESQYNGVSACPFEVKEDKSVESHGIVRLTPSARWVEDEHFHSDLRVSSNALCCKFQGRARECLALAFSPRAGYAKIFYEVCFGSDGNTRTVLRRGRNQSVVAPSKVCRENSWTSYWACLIVKEAESAEVSEKVEGEPKEDEVREATETASEERDTTEHKEDATNKETEEKGGEGSKKVKKKYNNAFYVGLGEIPGKDCIGILRDNLHGQSDDEETPFRYVGFRNRAVRDRQAPAPLQIRNITFCEMSNDLAETLNGLSDLNTIHVEGMDEETKVLMKEYEEQCKKARTRAERFGLPYKEPPSFLPWSQQRRLKANPKEGFQTGLDLSDPKEKEKQEARRKRFGTALDEMEKTENKSEKSIAIEQAWDKENFVRSQRTDPPKSLWKKPPEDTSDGNGVESFTMDAEVPKAVLEKLHIFSMDWAAFKQIRTDDIMALFSIYGPSYVEWLGDLSCNVHFQDRFSASRALQSMSQEIPTPPPETLDASHRYVNQEPEMADTPSDLGAMGWRLGKQLLRKIKTDRFGQRGTTARLLMRVATSNDMLHQRPTSWPKPPPGFSTKRVLGPHSDREKKRGPRRDEERKRGHDVDGSRKRGHNNDGKRKKVQRSKRTREASQTQTDGTNLPLDGSDHPLLNSSLRNSRPGFSVEELEAERSSKRPKVVEATVET